MENHSYDFCSICNSELKKVSIKNIVKNGTTYNIYECENCLTSSTHPAPTKEDLSKFYSSGNYRTEKGKRFNPVIELCINFSRLLKKRRIKRYVKKGRILDVGCGRGLFLNVMKKDGWSVIGNEFNDETASSAVNVYGIEVISGNLEKSDLPSESFDVININHVLEHLHNPPEILAECKRLLKKGGLLIVTVPDISSLQATLGKSAWIHLDVPCHLFHFSEKSLSRLLQSYSLKIMRIRRFDLEYNVFGWLQTLLNLSWVQENLLYDILKSRNLRREALSNVSFRDLVLTFSLLPIYFPISIVLSVFESLIFKKGGSVEIFALKE